MRIPSVAYVEEGLQFMYREQYIKKKTWTNVQNRLKEIKSDNNCYNYLQSCYKIKRNIT